ncbi:MAG TPA: MnhB domain-containing protein [Bryobacteraceae bacterium]|jgi:multicomponent Na+:H+ antiporter subunit B|nr:MnhB domain-containing protein [Bryobacteraceae bacterium]
MTRPIRTLFFFVSAALLALAFWLSYSDLAPLGRNTSAYGDLVNSITVPQRHITDAVTAVNFDIRGFDTLGEEFILFASVLGVVLLMRRRSDDPMGDHEDKARGRIVPYPSDAVRVTALLLLSPMVLFGLYIVSHGQLTPGGGFQGGVVLSTAPLLFYLASTYPQFRAVTPPRLIEAAEAVGASAYIFIGGVCMALGGQFLENVLPLGKTGTLVSGGTVALIDLGVGLEVSAGFVLMMLVYLEELMEAKEQ